MNKWIGSIQTAIKDARLSRKGSSGPSKTKKVKKSKDGAKGSKSEDDELRLSPIPEAPPLQSATKLRPKGPAGRRPPQNRKTGQMATSMTPLAGSTSLLDSIQQEMDIDKRDSNSRMSFSMSNLSTLPTPQVVSVGQTTMEKNFSVEAITVNEQVIHESEETRRRSNELRDVGVNRIIQSNGTEKRDKENKPVAMPRHTVLQSVQMSLVNELQNELQKQYQYPNNRVSRMIHERRNSSAQDYVGLRNEIAGRQAINGKSVSRRESGDRVSHLGDLKASISQVANELKDVKNDIGNLQEILSEKHKCDTLQEQLEAGLRKVQECQERFAEVMTEAEQARDKFKLLAQQCQVILKSLQKEEAARRHSSPLIDQIFI
jgi:hypothetical protein